MKRLLLVLGMVSLAGCVSTTEPQDPQPAPRTTQKTTPQPAKSLVASKSQVNQFQTVVRRMEPVAEQICRQRTQTRPVDCDFKIVLDTRRNQPPNAYQSQDASGRPVLTFTQALVADVRNQDELAFVVGHEAAHHIQHHLSRKQGGAIAGAVLGAGIAAVLGGGGAAVDMASNVGANVGARSNSKNYELEADALGTVITKRAGYNPVRGAEYFNRIPDPGDRFLGSHPPNAKRIETVRAVNAKL